MKEAYSLGVFKPSLFQSEIIEAELKPFLPPCCKRERISVRIPMGIPPHYDNMQWHQDGEGPLGTVRHMIVWASEDPTHIRTSDGTVLEFKPFDLIWFNNDLCHHKQPLETRASERWFVSIRCSGELI